MRSIRARRRNRALAALFVLAAGGGCGSSSENGSDAGSNPDGGGEAPSAAGVVAAGVRWFGRVDTTDATRPKFSWSGSGFVARFMGSSLSMQISVSGAPEIFKAVVDDMPQPTFTAASGQGTYPLAAGLTAGVHTVAVYRQTEGAQGETQLMALAVDDGAATGMLMDPPAGPGRLIEVVGDSITAGYGTLGALPDTDCFPTESAWDTYGAVAARALGAEVSLIAASGRGVIRNYGGDTFGLMPAIYGRTHANLPAPAWDFHIEPQAVVINLGTNDISNNKGDPGDAFRDAYAGLLQTVRSKYPHTWIVGIIGPLTSSSETGIIQQHIRDAVAIRAAAGDTRVELFDQIAPQTQDKFACQYHPNVAENMLMGDQIAAELRAKLGW